MEKQIVKFLSAYGIKSWICGGTARNLYCNKEITHYDVAVQATLSDLRGLLGSKLTNINEYNTSVYFNYKNENVILYPLKKIDLVNTYYNYSFTNSLEEDAASRDFTINALYYDPITNEWTDFFNSRQDIDNKVIKFIGNGDTKILESKIRILRAPVFASVLGDDWYIHSETINAIHKNRLKLVTVNSKQIYPELAKVLTKSEYPSKFFKFLRFTHILDDFFLELLHCSGIEQSNKANDLDLFNHIMYTIDSIPINKNNTLLLRTAGLLHDIGKPYTEVYTDSGIHFYNHENVGAYLAEKILFRWGFPKLFINKVMTLITNHLFDASPNKSDSSVKKLINKVGAENIHDLLELRIADRYGTGRKNISMKNIYKLRDKINTALSELNPKEFKLQISDDSICELLNLQKPSTEIVTAIKTYLEFRIINRSLINKESNLKKAIMKVNKIPCPLGLEHLYKTNLKMQDGSVETFPDGRLECGIFCNFACNQLSKKKIYD